MKVEMKYSADHLKRFPNLTNKPITIRGVEKFNETDSLYELTVRGTVRWYHKKAYEYAKVVEE